MEPDNRDSWDRYFCKIAVEVSTRATCPRKHVGCVITKDRVILSTGYNGSIREAPHCNEVGCLLIDKHCVRTSHAEINAISLAARCGGGLDGSTAYVTSFPCWNCFKALCNAGIKRVCYVEEYVEHPDKRKSVEESAFLLGIRIEKVLL